MHRQELAAAVAAEGLRPPLEPSLPSELKALLEQSWHADPRQRPTAAALVDKLSAILQSLEKGALPAILFNPNLFSPPLTTAHD